MARRRKVLDPAQLVPGGILESDTWHGDQDPGTCSRCGRQPPEEEVPLLFWTADRAHLVRYCATCIEVQA